MEFVFLNFNISDLREESSFLRTSESSLSHQLDGVLSMRRLVSDWKPDASYLSLSRTGDRTVTLSGENIFLGR
jgi:hypothetical protein